MQQQNSPKILHRIYFDNFAPFHDPFEHFLESWVREMPGYTIMRWNQSNLDVHANGWTTKAFEAKAPVFLAEYFRWKLLDEYGGLYLDADCEILDGKVLRQIVDDLYASDDYDVFFGVEERANGHPTAQTVGAKVGAELVRFMRNLYESSLEHLWPWREKRGLIGPQLMAAYYLGRGFNIADDGFFKNLDQPVVIDRAKVYPQSYFSPKFTILGDAIDYEKGKTCVYHMFANSNVDFSGKKQLKKAREQALTFAEYRESIADAGRFPRRYDASWLMTQVGRHTDEGIVAKNVDGTVLYGPYVTLPRGDYTARLHFADPPMAGRLQMSVTSGGGQRRLASRSFAFDAPRTGRTIALSFSIAEDAANEIEVVAEIAGVPTIGIESIEFDTGHSQQPVVCTPGSLKVLHRIYFGFDGKPDVFGAYLDTWPKQLPDFQIMHWNASNLPMDINPYVRQLYAEKDHAFLTDYFRWYVLREYGGSYLDADVEIVNGGIYRRLISELESASNYDSFIGIDERSGGWYTAHSMASKPDSALARFMCELYENFGSFTAWRKRGFYFWAPQLVGLYFTHQGHHKEGMGTTPRLDAPVIVAGVKIYPQDWFSPLAPGAHGKEVFQLNGLSDNTCLCHHFACSWHEDDSIYLQHSRTRGGQASTMLRDIVGTLSALPNHSGAELPTLAGRKEGSRIVTNGKSGFLVYGPYVTLTKGSYRLKYQLDEVRRTDDAAADIVADHGAATILAPVPVRFVDRSGDFMLDFSLDRTMHMVEFRMMVGPRSDFSVSRVSLHQAS